MRDEEKLIFGIFYKRTLKKLKKPIFWLIILVVIILFIVVYRHHHGVVKAKVKPEGLASASVLILNQSDIVVVKHGNVDSTVAFTGDLSPLTHVVISSEVGEEVNKVLVKEGELVKKNQLLAVLDDTDLRQTVSEGKAQLAIAQSQFELDKTTLERNFDLYKQGFISKVQYDGLKNSYQSSLQKVNQYKATLQRYQKQLANTQIRAPFTGYIYQKSIDPGQFVAVNAKLFSLANLDVMEITAAIPSDQINAIKPSQPVSFMVEADSIKYSAKVTRVNPVAESGTRAYLIYIDFDNTKYKLRAGQFAKGLVSTKQVTNVDYVASNVIRKNGAGNSYVLSLQNGVVVLKPVAVLLVDMVGGVSAVTGLNVGDKLLAGGVLTAKVGDKVKIMD